MNARTLHPIAMTNMIKMQSQYGKVKPRKPKNVSFVTPCPSNYN